MFCLTLWDTLIVTEYSEDKRFVLLGVQCNYNLTSCIFQSIIEEILSRISVDGVEVHILTLICSPETLKARLQQDIDNRLRTVDVIDRALDRLAATERLTTRRIDTEGRTPDEIACQILNVR